MMLSRQQFGFASTLLIVGLMISGCAVASEEQSGPGADGVPGVTIQCAPDAADCEDSVVTSTTDTTAQDDPSTTDATTTTQAVEPEMVLVAFTTVDGQCDDVLMFEREIDASRDLLFATFEGLAGGPTAQEAASGATSHFSTATADTMVSATLEQGLLVIDFEDLRSIIPNASTSCGSMALLAQLNATAFQSTEVERVRYEIEGSCDTFSNWLERECMEYTRDGAQPAQP